MAYFKRALVIAICALLYYWCFYLNKFIFDELEFSFGVNWIFIPSGLQLVMVLVAIEEAAIGIALAACLIGFDNYQLNSLVETLITAIIAGGSPLLARKICLDFLGVDKELFKLNPKSIFFMSIVFALLSSTLHQLWYSYNGVTQQFAQSLAVMAIGDFLGTALLLSVISSASKLMHRLTSPRS
jgi:hypothetical protein